MKVRSRFAYFRDKLQVFFLGLLFGLVLGGGFFVLKLDQYVKELSFYKSLTQKNEKPDEEDVLDTKQDTEKPKTKKTKKEQLETNAADSSSDQHSITSADTTLPVEFTSPENSDDNIVIRKDELLGQKTYPLVTASSDTTSSKENTSTPVTIEFWKSPLNYKGYKYSHGKAVLFGFVQEDIVSLSRLDNSTFLKTVNGVFRIEPSPDFHQLERVTDESLLARLQ